MASDGVVAVGGRPTDWVSLGVLAAFVSCDAVDDAAAAAGRCRPQRRVKIEADQFVARQVYRGQALHGPRPARRRRWKSPLAGPGPKRSPGPGRGSALCRAPADQNGPVPAIRGWNA